MEEKRIEAFEKMLNAILSQYDSTVEKRWKSSKRRVKKKLLPTASFLRVSCKLQAMLSYYRTYGLIEEK